LRVFHATNRVRPGLAVSRSLGDVEAHAVGVSSDPDILHIELKEEEDVIILASDGIWDMMSGKMILDRLDKNGWHVQNFEKIVLEAARRWIFSRTGVSDDLSMIILRLNYDQAAEKLKKPFVVDEHKPIELTEEKELKEDMISPTAMDIPRPSFGKMPQFDVKVDPSVEIDSPTQTITDEQKIKRASERRGSFTVAAEVVNSDQAKEFEFKNLAPDQLDQAAIDALETNSLPPQDKNYLLELEADMSQYSVENDSIDGNDHQHDKERDILELELEHEKERVIQLEKSDLL
jgi:hypothetical protein